MAEEQMTEEDIKKKREKNAEAVYQALSKKTMTEADKTAVGAVLNEDPNFLLSPEFMAKIAPKDMNRCPQEGYAEYIDVASKQLELTSTVLANLDALQKEGGIGSAKGGKTQVQYLLDEGKLPNGETMGTQTVKNIMYLRAMKKDEAYSDKDAVNSFHESSMNMLRDMYSTGGPYAANPNRRNVTGQKIGDLMNMHLGSEKNPERRVSTVADLKAKPYQTTLTEADADKFKAKDTSKDRKELNVESGRKALTIEQLLEKAYREGLTVEEAGQLKQVEKPKKEADMVNEDGDKNTKKREPSSDKFKDEDIVKYMYEDWFLGGASMLFNKIEDRVLGIIDSACEIAASTKAKRDEMKKEIKDAKIKNAVTQVGNLEDIYEAYNRGKHDVYGAKKDKYDDMFADLKENIGKQNPQWRYQFDPQFIASLNANPEQAKLFTEVGPEAIKAQINILERLDKLSAMATRISMTDQYMRDEKAWLNDKKEPKTNDEMKDELAAGTLAHQKKLQKAIAVISEDTRIMAEIAYAGIQNPTMSKEEFIQSQVNKGVNDFLTEYTEDLKKIEAQQNKEIEEQHFSGRGNKGPDKQIKDGLQILNDRLDTIIQKGEMYKSSEFEREKSAGRVEKTTTLFEEAQKQNAPSVFEAYKGLVDEAEASVKARRAANEDRKQQLAAFKSRLDMRDGQNTVDSRIALMQAEAQGRGA